MKAVIASTGNSLESLLDKHFARCAYFVVYNSESQSTEFFTNPYQSMEEGAGPTAVEWIKNRGVERIITGELGLKIKPLLDSLKIQMIVLKDKEISIQEIIALLNH